MRNLLIGLITASFSLTLVVGDLQAAETKSKESKPPTKGEHFDMTGTVKKAEMDPCMLTGLHYWLHPKKGEDVRLSPTSKHDSQALDNAEKNNSSVHVMGTWDETLKCSYVKVSRVAKSK